jgi:ParB family chromosome partitioning protein
VVDNKSTKTRRGLGKGLGSLILSSDAESGVNIDFTEIPINKVEANPNQPRIDFSEERLAELQESIRKDGLLQPIIVRPVGSGYQIVAGERRWQACKRLGYQTIAAKVIIVNDIEAQEISLVENLQRDNLNPIEEARGYQRLIDISGRKQKDIAESVSKNQATISNALRLLSLPEEVQEMMFEGKLSAGHGRAVLSVSDEEVRVRLATKIIDESLSVREAESIARLYGTHGLERSKRLPTPRSFKLVARRLRQQLETSVRVKSVRGKNRIEIEFKDEEDLQRIVDLLGNVSSRTEAEANNLQLPEPVDFEEWNNRESVSIT